MNPNIYHKITQLCGFLYTGTMGCIWVKRYGAPGHQRNLEGHPIGSTFASFRGSWSRDMWKNMLETSRLNLNGCEILHHQKDGWKFTNNGISHLPTGADFFHPWYYRHWGICPKNCDGIDGISLRNPFARFVRGPSGVCRRWDFGGIIPPKPCQKHVQLLCWVAVLVAVATCWVPRGGLPWVGMSLQRVTYVKIMYIHPQPFSRRKFHGIFSVFHCFHSSICKMFAW